jgi:iron complex outermembrane receptor protein
MSAASRWRAAGAVPTRSSQRGFYSDSDGNFRRNGIEISKFTSILSPNAERIEVLKGPASVLFGRIDPGGVINVVTKRPQPVRFSELDLRGGAFGYVDGRVDTTGPIGDGSRALYRLNVSSDRTGSYRDEVEKRNTYILPSITTFLGSRARWDIDVEYKREEKTDDVGIAAPENNFDALDAMPIDTFLGEPEAGVDLWYANGVSTFEHMLGSSWTFRNTLSYVHYDSTSRGVSLGSLAADRRTVSRTASFNESTLGSALAEASVLGSFSTGPLRHRVAAGGSYHHYSQDQQGSSAAIAGVDIYDPVYTGLPAEPSVLSGDTLLTVANSGLFIQDQIEVTPQLHLQVGARVSTFKQETDNRLTVRTQVIEADNVSTQVGAAYLPRPWLSFYGSFSESFSPNLAIARDGSTFGPKKADQYEGGVKADAWGGRLTATASVFRLTYEGTLSFIRDPVTGLFDTTQGGVQRSTGVELDVMARPGAGFLITGTFGTLDAYVVTDPVYAPGRLLGGAPKRRGNLWVAWESPRGLGVGAGVFQSVRVQGVHELELPPPRIHDRRRDGVVPRVAAAGRARQRQEPRGRAVLPQRRRRLPRVSRTAATRRGVDECGLLTSARRGGCSMRGGSVMQ